MDDKAIIGLYLERNEKAIEKTDLNYGKYLKKIAFNLLKNKEDVEECVDDTYVKAWNSIPPTIPQNLLAYLAKITRNTAISRLFAEKSSKRNKETRVVLEEIAEIIPAKGLTIENRVALKVSINAFLESIEKTQRVIFVKRYFYAYSVKEIAKEMDFTQSNVKVILHRTRNSLKDFLKGEGIEIWRKKIYLKFLAI